MLSLVFEDKDILRHRSKKGRKTPRGRWCFLKVPEVNLKLCLCLTCCHHDIRKDLLL